MSVKTIQKLLESVLIGDQPMSEALLLGNLIGYKDEFLESLKMDAEDVIFAIDQSEKDVAMLLIEKNGDVYKNKEAKERLQFYWKHNYKNNLKQLIPSMAAQLKAGEFALLGFTVENSVLA